MNARVDAHPGAVPVPAELAGFPGFNDFDTRLTSLLEVFPLYELMAKNTLRGYCGFELGICLLLFIMEKMLRYEPCTYEDAQEFLGRLLPLYAASPPEPETVKTVTEKLLNELSNYGSPFEYSFRHPLRPAPVRVRFRLLEQEPFSLPDRDTVKIRLTREGLDVLFKSREIYRDLRFSVMQFYLDQQIRRGTFEGALQTVRELGVEVTSSEHQLTAMREEIRRNVVEAMSRPDYSRLINRMSRQLKQERDTFDNLIRLVRETRQNLTISLQDRGNTRQQQVARLEQELYRVSQRHLVLFDSQLELNSLVEEALITSLRSTLMVRFHLEKELLAGVLRQNPSGRVLGQVALQPLLRPRLPRVLDLFTFLAPQTLLSRQRERPPEEVPGAVDLEAERARQKLEWQRYTQTVSVLQRIFRLLLTPLLQKRVLRLSEVTARLEQEQWEEVEVAALLHTVLLLHQAGRIQARLPWDYVPGDGDLLEFALYRLLQEEPSLAGIGTVLVTAGKGSIHLPDGMEMSEMTFYRSEADGL